MDRIPPTIDMLPDGRFRVPPRRPVVPFSAKMLLAAVAVTAIGVSLLVATLAVWVISMLLPVIIIGGAVAWGLYRFKRWQLFRSQAGGQAGHDAPTQTGRFR